MTQGATVKMQRGAAGERFAAAYLARRGVCVLARNLRCRVGELDLVCLDGEVLVIVEVRQRGPSDFGGAAASVTRLKQRKLIRATQFHCQRMPQWLARRLRFDVIALETSGDGRLVVEWIRDAFRAT